MYLGSYRIGDSVPLTFQVTDHSDSATLPDAAPVVRIYRAGTLVTTFPLPVIDRFRVTGLFHQLYKLGAQFSVGNHSLVYKFDLSGTPDQEVDTFDVIAGGQFDGPVLAMHTFDRADVRFILQHMGSGRLRRGRNPVIP